MVSLPLNYNTERQNYVISTVLFRVRMKNVLLIGVPNHPGARIPLATPRK